MSVSFTFHGRSCSTSLRNSLVGRQRPCYFFAAQIALALERADLEERAKAARVATEKPRGP